MNIGEYRILKRIGCGGSSQVFSGVSLLSGEKVCIKELDLSFKDFWTEAYLLRKLSHKSIPKAIDLIGQGNKVYLVMTLFSGVSPLNLRFSYLGLNRLMLDMAEVLNFLHSQEPKVIYCDFKPTNILCGRDNYLLDFGLAKEEGSNFFRNIYFSGTRKYMDPLIPRRDISPSISSDIYSWGATYLELLRVNNIEIHKKVDSIICRCMSLDVHHRYPSFKYVIRDLRRLF